MKILVLNPVYTEAVRVMGISMTALCDADTFYSTFSDQDQEQILIDSHLVATRSELVGYGLEGFLDEDFHGHNYESTPVSSNRMDYVISRMDPTALNARRSQLHETDFCCAAVDSNTVVLYAVSDEEPKYGATIGNLLDALTLIMSVNAVMQTRQYQHFCFE